MSFKFKPMFGGTDSKNYLEGSIKLNNELIATLNGKWNGEIKLNEKYSSDKQISLWNPTKEIIEKRLKRFDVLFSNQFEYESQK